MVTVRRIFCDTNILLDVFDPDRRSHADAIALLWFASENPETVRLLASISSFKDAYYILSRLYKDETRARECIASFMGRIIEPVDMLASYGPEALSSSERDFEDALIAVSAEHEKASVLVTHDKGAFKECAIPVMTTAAFLKSVDFDYELIDW